MKHQNEFAKTHLPKTDDQIAPKHIHPFKRCQMKHHKQIDRAHFED